MKVLIELNSNIGDLVMNLPILNYLHNNFNAEIDVIVDKRSMNLLSETKFINNVFVKEKNFKAKTKLFVSLLKYKYDLAIGLRSDAVPLVIRAKKKLYKKDRDSSLFDKTSETLYHFSILKKFYDISDNDVDTNIMYSQDSLSYVLDLIKYEENEKILFVAPGANFEFKIWPKENYIELINNVKEEFDKVILVGAPNEIDICNEISSKTNALNLAGKTNLVQASALLSLGKLFIGNDSGLGHISAAQKVPTFSVFAHANPTRYTPYKQHSIYREDKDIKKISVENVLDSLKEKGLIS